MATAVVGGALVRQGNHFIVSVTPAQLGELLQTGITGEVVWPDVDVDQLYLVGVARPSIVPEAVEWDIVGPSLTLDGNRRIVQMSRAMAASIAAGFRLGAVPLSRRTVPIRYLPPVVAVPRGDVFPHDSLAVLVNQDSIYSYTKSLEDFYTRYVFTDSIDRARDWLVEKFEQFGYTDVAIQPFWHSSWAGTGYGYNVKVVKPGVVEPDQVVLIGAHYDSYTGYQPWICAPGADDDGSGVALMMEIARLLADQPLRKTVIFMAFSAEEQWMYGSGYAAEQFYAEGTDLEVMYNYDMVGYTDDEVPELFLYSVPYDVYRDVTAAAAV